MADKQTITIKLNGVTTSPSDYECLDGDLASTSNLTSDESLKPTPSPILDTEIPDGYKPHYIHLSPDNTERVILSKNTDDGVDYYYIKRGGIISVPIPLFSTKHPTQLYNWETLGNTLIALASDGMHYFLWKANKEDYTDLGSHLPEIAMEFALAHGDESYLKYTGWKNEEANLRKFTMEIPWPERSDAVDGTINVGEKGNATVWHKKYVLGEKDTKYYRSDKWEATLAEHLFAGINRFIADETSNNRFVLPFFVRFAYRLFDGNYVMHSAPILMTPNAIPVVNIYEQESDKYILKLYCNILAVASTLCFRFLNIHNLKDWKDIITSIDIFVSAPLYKYKPDAGVYEVVDKPNAKDLGFYHSGYNADLSKYPESTQFGTRADEDKDISTSPIVVEKSNFTAGNSECSVADLLKSPPNNSWNYTPWYNDIVLNGEKTWSLPTKTDEEFMDELSSVSNFYQIASIPLDDVATSTDFHRTPIQSAALTALTSRTQLPDDWNSHDSLISSRSYTYNSRLIIGNVLRKPFEGFPYRSLTQYASTDNNQYPIRSMFKVDIFVLISSTDGDIWCRHNGGDSLEDFILEPLIHQTEIPRFVYYPNPSATKMVIRRQYGDGSQKEYRFDLKPHPTLSGAYFTYGLGKIDIEPLGCGSHLSILDSISQHNRIYNSYVNNPFAFPVTSIHSVGNGTILGMAAATTAMSMGQFGQYPLYAFTTEGVWSLNVSAEGVFTSMHPLSRDVCTNPDAIIQIDDKVLFPSARGLMAVAGSQVQCISDALKLDASFDASNLKGIDKVDSALLTSQLKSFSEFINDNNTRLIYDYANSRIYATNSNKEKWPLTYIYSIASQSWTLADYAIVDGLNSYPDTIIIDTDGNLATLPNENDITSTFSSFVTRPLKLGSADTYKTITELAVRGIFDRNKMSAILYGSRDLKNWHVITSVKGSNIITNTSGSPYKYFVVSASGVLAEGDSISALDVTFYSRLTNKLR